MASVIYERGVSLVCRELLGLPGWIDIDAVKCLQLFREFKKVRSCIHDSMRVYDREGVNIYDISVFMIRLYVLVKNVDVLTRT